MNQNNQLTARRIQLICDALRKEALTLAEVSARVFLCQEHARRYLRELHRAGVIHIAAWPKAKVTRQPRVPAYLLGAGPDAVKPPRMTPQQATAAYRARVRSNPDRLDIYLARARALSRKPARDPLVAAMFGAPRPVEAEHA